MKTKPRKVASRKRPNRKPPSPTSSASLPSPKPTLPFQLSSLNLAKILSGFMTFRSTVRDLSTSIQKVESMMDSAYRMFEVASQIMPQTRQSGRQQNHPFPTRPRFSNPSEPGKPDEDDIPIIRLPMEERQAEPPFPFPNRPHPMNRRGRPGGGGLSFASLLQNMDLNQIMGIVQSPFFQKMIANILQPKETAQTSNTPAPSPSKTANRPRRKRA
ncbi:hypothetical protein [Hazenella coriacea]|uniref:Uncharacterized protein n=1 Tax=Hazenella coriacea TaxID=1179467 RepID=A0A4R3L1V5_9BACL|nr:hypothetical protein [Hazenella coriacea]TCS93409.1 hypothetical protein EDD58_10756 [Hazenella coriacea]